MIGTRYFRGCDEGGLRIQALGRELWMPDVTTRRAIHRRSCNMVGAAPTASGIFPMTRSSSLYRLTDFEMWS